MLAATGKHYIRAFGHFRRRADSAEMTQKAVDALNGVTLDGRNLTVNEAKPREERSGGGYGGGRDRGARSYGQRY